MYRLLLMILLALTLAPMAAAAPWRAEPGVLDGSLAQRLKERYPEIKSAADLEDLLRDIGRRQQQLDLTAELEGGTWVLKGRRAPLVTDVEVEVVSRFLRAPLEAAVQVYVSQVDSPETQAKVREVIQKNLRRRGYPGSRVRIDVERSNGELVYVAKVNEGNPCIIERIELGFKLPRGADFDLKAGEICDVEEIETSISELELSLREMGYNQLKIELADVAYDMKRDTAVVFIAGTLGQKVRYEIVDQTRRFLIDDLFGEDELAGVDPTIVGPDAMGAELQRRYSNRGFADVTIKGPEVRKVGDDEFVYVFDVNPGRQYVLSGVVFEGVTVFKEQELLDIMGLESFWQTSKPLNGEEIQAGLDALRARYLQAGYWDVKVRDPGGGQRDRDTGTVRLTIQVSEGLQRVLRRVVPTGNATVSSREIEKLFPVQPGDPLDRSKLVDFQQAVRTVYVSKGFLYAEVALDLSATEARKRVEIDVGVKVTEGARVKIGDVTIVGLTRTEQKVVQRELLFEEGDWYDPERISLTRQALTRLGLFRSVQIVPADRNALSQKEKDLDLLVDVREGRAGSVSFGPGWSLVRGWNYETEASYNNIGGVGRQASVRGQISEERHQEAIGKKTLIGRKIGTGYLEPWIFDVPVDAAVSAGQKAEASGSFWELSYTGEVALIHRLRLLLPGASIATFYGQKIAKTEGDATVEDELVATDARIGSTGFRFNLDRRDNLKFPTDGYTIDTEISWARYGLGGDLRYFKWDVGSGVYFGFLDDLVLAMSVQLTSYEGIERRNENLRGILPPSERLPAGGSESVRGYRPQSLGPTVKSPVVTDDCSGQFKKDNLNGNRRTIIKTELRHKLTDSLALTGFVDNGISFFSQDQMAKFADEYAAAAAEAKAANANCVQVRSVEDNIGYEYMELLKNPTIVWTRHYFSYGFSLNLLTALGSINFGYGLPWREPKSEACKADEDECFARGKQGGHWLTRGEFHLNVGARF